MATSVKPYKTTYKHQDVAITWAVEHLVKGPGVLIEMCVGSGKTLVAMVIANILHQMDLVDRIVIIAPQKAIRDQFENYSNKYLKSQDKLYLTQEIKIALGTDHLCGMFNDARLGGTLVVATTYDTWRNCFDTHLKNEFHGSWDKTLIIIDEGHHVSQYETEDELLDGVRKTSNSIQGARDRGAKTIQLTATAARRDGYEVVLKDDDGNEDPKFTRSLLDQINEGFAPIFAAKIIPLSGSGVSDSKDLYQPTNLEGFDAIVNDLKAHGCPLSLIRMRCPSNSDDHKKMRDALKAKLKEAGIKAIVHTSEEEAPEFKQLQEAMERRDSYEKIKGIANVIIAHNKFNEGVDLPAFSTLYLWGIPYSMPLLVQLCGRVLRLRYDFKSKKPLYQGYPKQFLDQSRVVFCTSATRGVSDDKEEEFMHQLCGWLHSLEVGTLLSRMARIDDSLHGTKSRSEDEKAKLVERNGYIARVAEPGYIADATAWLNSLSDSMDEMSDRIRGQIIALKAKELIGDDPKLLDIPDLDGVIDEAAKNQVALETGNLELVSKKEEGPDNLTQQAIDEARREFIELVKYTDRSMTQWLISGVLKDHYTKLGKATGVLTKLEDHVSCVDKFLATKKRYPGTLGIPLTEERVPEAFYYFSACNSPWKKVHVERFLQGTKLSAEVRGARIAWKEHHGDGPTQSRTTFSKFYKDVRFQANPLVTYYPYIIWISASYSWTANLNFEEWDTLGEWSARGFKYPDDNSENVAVIDAFVKRHGVDKLIYLIKTDGLDSLRNL